jgi:hypothetical protein
MEAGRLKPKEQADDLDEKTAAERRDPKAAE